MAQRVVFRTDASLDIGTGHVMRCLTLADEIRTRGGECEFICRDMAGHLGELIVDRGHSVTMLPTASPHQKAGLEGYEAWLTVPQAVDASDTVSALKRTALPDWLIVDHYALDVTWEIKTIPYARHLLVIDDLANRQHRSDILLDQSLGRITDEYEALVTPKTTLLCGTNYALLRPEFARWRNSSLKRRITPAVGHILISLGGVDRDNATCKILRELEKSFLPSTTKVSVVMGKTAPWLQQVEKAAGESRFTCSVLSNINTMAPLMSEADLAIGAVGATSWERCALGLPSVVTVLAENQTYAAQKLQTAGAALLFSVGDGNSNNLVAIIDKLAENPMLLTTISQQAASICDGKGCQRVASRLFDGEARS
jgi:UDP-2,4-diacetamido-2,4,6-trideoxy-beta-L-altropyranose hydrolase